MKKIFFIFFIFSILIIPILFSQEQQKESTSEAEKPASPPAITYENVSYNDILKKEVEIAELIDKINQIIKEMNITRSFSKRSSLKEESDKLKEQLKLEMQNYIAMVNSYNNKIFSQAKDVPIDPQINTTETELKNKENEIRNFVEKINNKIEQANSEANEAKRKALVEEIERLKKELQQKKLEYFKLVKSYNAQVEEKYKTNE